MAVVSSPIPAMNIMGHLQDCYGSVHALYCVNCSVQSLSYLKKRAANQTVISIK